MSLLTPKTIVIATVPGKTQPRPVTIQSPKEMEYFSDEQDGAPRKRRRLTHLTPEEKLMRRKLKNRVAAQTARDRKKAIMSDLEIQVAKLMEENKRLQRENSSLKERSSELMNENSSLKERLGTDVSLVKMEEETSGSAASFVSLPQGHPSPPSHPVMPYVLTLCASSTNKTTDANVKSVCQLQIKPRKDTQAGPNSSVVGPSPAELESINELIKFDHEYYKIEPLTPEPKMEVIIDSGVSSTVENKTDSESVVPDIKTEFALQEDCVRTVTEESPILCIEDIVDLEKEVLNVLPEINIDLLNDIESLIEDDLHRQAIPDSMDEVSQNGQLLLPNEQNKKLQSELTPPAVKHSKKRKFSQTIGPNSDLVSSDDYFSGSDSGIASDYSEAGSPYSDFSGGLSDNVWEESFIELFPNLV
ncbi:uncharacterized protein LOC133172327 [Saccostrea echinata]|uniref:uncharacterized protein LOC133172327 n=1 Tax=Saccostrea echinata TaxID=191078 RepID=UPI002A807999|nr:uncharacterized protein LOC133172327 [Saccostrea echinata]